MGVRIKTVRHQPVSDPWRFRRAFQGTFAVNIERDSHGEHFVFDMRAGLDERLQVELLQVKPQDRHLVLLVKDLEESTKDRFLCGHDEREWFVAAVPGAVSTVADAMESLKPEAVRDVQARQGLNRNQRNLRRNRAFRRQGEWFFIPIGETPIAEDHVLRNEPIARSGGQPHRVQFLYREGGQLIYTCGRFPNGLSQKEYAHTIRTNPKANNWGWQVQRINPRVLARGDIRHPDHRTITLHGWHEVLMNLESESRTMQHVAFID